MNTPADLYADWDGAYVLGALSPADRRDYERHLNDCVACSQAVAHLVGLPGLLAQVPLDQALQLDQPVDSRADAAPSATLLPRLVQAARAHTRRARLLAAGAVVAAAAIAASAALVLPGWLDQPGQSITEPAVAMTAVVPSPLTASFRLTGEEWGTRIDANCSYARGGDDFGAQPYALFVTDRDGQETLVASWISGPGSTISAAGTTSVSENDIASVDIRWMPDEKVLLESKPSW
ncbi:Putative zinc-finger [Cryobacterium flavum]|uniref:Zf-HC2 domain-containing protein n=1 Tax=Cryobacterium flavum TaxID=1424659 RepID=A0A4R8V056_9MICO|nr:zf-HC2 domain-containing protein [Cryobacterium flavum]TFB74411.1 zf-HC2 domain-containing protein [Cryobacterium flavum]SDN15009.1 Putative zinc-finger [Cryobacterium flavum]